MRHAFCLNQQRASTFGSPIAFVLHARMLQASNDPIRIDANRQGLLELSTVIMGARSSDYASMLLFPRLQSASMRPDTIALPDSWVADAPESVARSLSEVAIRARADEENEIWCPIRFPQCLRSLATS